MDESVLREDVRTHNLSIVDIHVIVVACAILLIVEEVDVGVRKLVGSNELVVEVNHRSRIRRIGVENDGVVARADLVKTSVVWKNVVCLL